MEFFIRCEPSTVTSQQKGTRALFGRFGDYRGLRHYKKPRVRRAEHELLYRFFEHRLSRPLEGALKLELTITFPWRSEDTKEDRAKLWIPKVTRPDCDNLVKMVLDVMTRLAFWKDDAQIVMLTVLKGYGSNPGYFVKLGEFVS